MNELKNLTEQILYNCYITDARHAGIYSICTLALSLRNLFKWEKGLDPWVEKNPAEVLDWIDKREQKWESLAEKDFKDISIQGKQYDPFDTDGINAVLKPHQLLYGAGFARNIKPTFFLADVEEIRTVDGCRVYFLAREWARDLFTCPAQAISGDIFIRKMSAKVLLWDQIFYVTKSGKNALKFALETYGLSPSDLQALHPHLDRILTDEIEIYLYHEIGEIKDTAFDRNIWQEIISDFPQSPVELLARTVKDLLANTCQEGMLGHIINNQKASSLGFYVAFMDSLNKKLFPQILEAFELFIQKQDWQLIEKALTIGYATACSYADAICSIYEKGKQKNDKKWAADKITMSLLEPLCA